MFNKIVDYFIPNDIQNDSVKSRQARVLIIVLLVAGVFNILGALNSIPIGFMQAFYLLAIFSIVCFVLSFLFKNGLPYQITVHLFASLGFIQIFLQACWSGGLESAATFALFLIPALSILLLGRKGSTFWLIIAILAVLFLYWYEVNYGQLPEMFDVSVRQSYLNQGIIGTMLCLFVIIFVIDKDKDEAFHDLFANNETLKATQNQLIQKEKLASLGELTAGIAHEIQNPLNFVTNFSELSVSIAQELKEEMNRTDVDAEYVAELLVDLTSNQEKINHHGKRASGIVKGMLEHSRTSTGVKELCNINILADEYLRLSYHGLRAKDKTFVADFKTNFDENLPQMEAIPQDIGRVLLNLFNNAFYAVQQRQKQTTTDLTTFQKLSNLKYTPIVTIATQNIDNQIIITIKDNGTGMPESVKKKIFQPFFTTKPTGEGTGLGLSLSYDIITKGHGGTLEVNSTEGEGTEFVISLPIKS
jgi:two-component system, NtrC family, sensor kinase